MSAVIILHMTDIPRQVSCLRKSYELLGCVMHLVKSRARGSYARDDGKSLETGSVTPLKSADSAKSGCYQQSIGNNALQVLSGAMLMPCVMLDGTS